ncbi:hypothetical protein [Sulfurovum riftiae]|uniref:Prepilin-type N-terminal cleavage/methylation domain-containing protein n=1 Tax=Sulfurovum riftiae TaxID=1630136 RepID=A0A151CHD4_9BACT|nr:hypothetical protein [Sulfurovum riftiae]KYJ86950.1 hypothetical protein AS592_00125 [Sulfurovum riftiae]
MKTLRPAFTIIEILISVIIISFSIVYVLRIHSQNHAQIVYITERNKLSLQDSLFLTDEALRYHKDTKDAYEMLQPYFKIDDLKSREILKKASREFFIPEAVNLTPEEGVGPSATVEEIKLKGRYSSAYFRFKISGF